MDNSIYMVSWSGGYELPDYFVTSDFVKALEKVGEWQGLRSETDDISILTIQVDPPEITKVEYFDFVGWDEE